MKVLISSSDYMIYAGCCLHEVGKVVIQWFLWSIIDVWSSILVCLHGCFFKYVKQLHFVFLRSSLTMLLLMSLSVGVLYRDAGNISLAIDAYEQCLNIDPDSRNAGQVLTGSSHLSFSAF